MINILEKIKEFFYKLIGKNETLTLEGYVPNEDKTDIRGTTFKNRLNVNNSIIDIQKLYEEDKIKEKELSIIEIFELERLYKEQIKELDIQIKTIKNELL